MGDLYLPPSGPFHTKKLLTACSNLNYRKEKSILAKNICKMNGNFKNGKKNGKKIDLEKPAQTKPNDQL